MPSGSLLEVVVRGTVLFLVLFLLLRLVPRRQIGSLGVSDLLVIVLLADAAQNGLAGEYKSITEGIALVRRFWGKLTDDDLDRIAGKREQLAGKIQESYGIGQDEAERQLTDWERDLDRR
jgi:uncharacterized protein YjbJ (UPF0337 family)